MVCGLTWFGSFEWFRESLRKPYVIYHYMYGNALEVAQIDSLRNKGYLAHMHFRTGDDGADLFRRSCQTCHTMNGYNALKPAFDGTDKEFITGSIKGVHVMKGNMPPFYGTDKEIQQMALHIFNRIDHRHLGEIYNLTGVELGQKVWDIRCGKCHVFGGSRDISESITGLEEVDYHDLLDMSGDLADEMPAFTGDERERKALIQYLLSRD
jgi:mono/diheme cytochrome c family protein